MLSRLWFKRTLLSAAVLPLLLSGVARAAESVQISVDNHLYNPVMIGTKPQPTTVYAKSSAEFSLPAAMSDVPLSVPICVGADCLQVQGSNIGVMFLEPSKSGDHKVIKLDNLPLGNSQRDAGISFTNVTWQNGEKNHEIGDLTMAYNPDQKAFGGAQPGGTVNLYQGVHCGIKAADSLTWSQCKMPAEGKIHFVIKTLKPEG